MTSSNKTSKTIFIQYKIVPFFDQVKIPNKKEKIRQRKKNSD